MKYTRSRKAIPEKHGRLISDINLIGMKKSVFALFLLSVFVNMFGQNGSDSIAVVNRLGPVFRQNGTTLTPNKLLEITKSNQEAFSEMKIAKNNYTAGMIFQLPGGFLIGYPLGTAVAGGDPNWTLAAIGAGFVVISIPFISAYNKHAGNAVSIYNKGLRYSTVVRPELKFGITCNGPGFYLRF